MSCGSECGNIKEEFDTALELLRVMRNHVRKGNLVWTNFMAIKQDFDDMYNFIEKHKGNK